MVPPRRAGEDLPELIALAKAKPGKLTYGHAGVGTSQHLAGELFKSMAGVSTSGRCLSRLDRACCPICSPGASQHVFGNIVNVAPLVREGKLRAFAVTSRKRSALVPELPTMAESAIPGFEAVPGSA